MAAWDVLRQETMTVAAATGGFHTVIRVHFRTDAGNVGYVDVPRAAYDRDTVRGLIAAHAAELDAVSELHG